MSDQFERLKGALSGHYEIEREIGAGGMATVYLARDIRHDRHVAIKVLRPDLAASLGADRFLREIRIAANLTHPHILPVHDSGEAGGFLYYVMPFIDGESLRKRLDREGELPVPDTARILRDVLDALVTAHGQSIVHRDIKPDNVLLVGRHALVADFGVAKAVSEATGRHNQTTIGVALGTPTYMAPEQVSGDPYIDHRADLYAVGAMAYEMLTGQPPFVGPSMQDILTGHLAKAPVSITDTRANLPPALAALVMRCLEKKPADRIQTAAELIPTLEALSASTSTLTPPETIAARAVTPSRSVPRWMVGALGAAGIVVVALIAYVMSRPGSTSGQSALVLGQRSQVSREATLEIDPALSPNGQFMAYASGNASDFKVYVRQIDGGTPIAVAPDLGGVQRFPAWSPDGGQLIFRSTRGIEIVPATGGVSRRVGTLVATDRVTWSPDGSQIAWVSSRSAANRDSSNTLLVTSRDGDEKNIRTLVGASPIHSPAWSPDGRWIAYVNGNVVGINTPGNIGPSEIWVVPAAGGDPVQVTDSGGFNASPAWLGSTLLLVSDRDGGRDVYAVELTTRGGAAGQPRAVTTGVGTLSISVAADVKRIGYSVFLDRSNVWSMPVPTTPPGSSLDARPVTTGNQVVENAEVSRDGRWLAFDADRAGNQDIYKQRLDGGPVMQLTTDPADDFGPTWSVDGSEIVFYSYRGGIARQLLIMPSEGGPQTRIAEGELSSPEWSWDGTMVAVRKRPDNALVLVRRISGGWSTPEIVVPRGLIGSYFAWSPDDQSIAYTSAEGLSVVSVAAGTSRLIVPMQERSGQFHPQWSADGRTIYYIDNTSSGIFAIAAAGGGSRPIVQFDPARPWHRYTFQALKGHFYFTLGEMESDLWVADLVR